MILTAQSSEQKPLFLPLQQTFVFALLLKPLPDKTITI
jgi:hypothetical protein